MIRDDSGNIIGVVQPHEFGGGDARLVAACPARPSGAKAYAGWPGCSRPAPR